MIAGPARRRLKGIVSQSGGSGATTHPSLLAGLSLSLDFENGGNLGLDRTGQNNLANVNSLGQGAGKVGSGAGFWTGAGQSLTHVDAASLEIGAGALTITFWLKPTDPAGNSADVVSKWDSVTDKEYLFWFNRFNSMWDWRVGGDTNIVNISTAVLPFGSWSFVELGWTAAGVASITVNNGTPATFAGSPATITGAVGLNIGGTVAGGVYNGNYDGYLDNFNLWQRPLIAAERTFLASGVTGSEYPF